MARPVTGELRELPNNSLPWGTPLHPLALLKSPLPQGHISICHREIFGLCAVDSTCRFLATYYMKLPLEIAKVGKCPGGVCEAITDTMSCALFTKVITSPCLFSEPRRHSLELYFYIILMLITPQKCLLSFFSSFQTHYMTNTLQWDKIMLWWPKPDNYMHPITLCSSSHQRSFI